MKSGNVSSLSFYDIVTSSTGTFRYSTLTASGLTALPPVSLLYFNNFVIAGAYVWPGQTISALNWSLPSVQGSNYNATTLSNRFITSIQAGNIQVAQNVTGGTPPYTFTDVTVGYPYTQLSPIGTGTAPAYSSINYLFTGGGSAYGGLSTTTGIISGYTYVNTGTFIGSAGATGSSSQYNSTIYVVRLTDSSIPPFTKDFYFKFGIASALG